MAENGGEELKKIKEQNLQLSTELKKAKSILAGIKNKDQVAAVVTQNEQLKKLVQQHKTKVQQLTDDLQQSNEKNLKLQSELQALSGGVIPPSPSPTASATSSSTS